MCARLGLELRERSRNAAIASILATMGLAMVGTWATEKNGRLVVTFAGV